MRGPDCDQKSVGYGDREGSPFHTDQGSKERADPHEVAACSEGRLEKSPPRARTRQPPQPIPSTPGRQERSGAAPHKAMRDPTQTLVESTEGMRTEVSFYFGQKRSTEGSSVFR
jgi:hypothetical protein